MNTINLNEKNPTCLIRQGSTAMLVKVASISSDVDMIDITTVEFSDGKREFIPGRERHIMCTSYLEFIPDMLMMIIAGDPIYFELFLEDVSYFGLCLLQLKTDEKDKKQYLQIDVNGPLYSKKNVTMLSNVALDNVVKLLTTELETFERDLQKSKEMYHSRIIDKKTRNVHKRNILPKIHEYKKALSILKNSL